MRFEEEQITPAASSSSGSNYQPMEECDQPPQLVTDAADDLDNARRSAEMEKLQHEQLEDAIMSVVADQHEFSFLLVDHKLICVVYLLQ